MTSTMTCAYEFGILHRSCRMRTNSSSGMSPKWSSTNLQDHVFVGIGHVEGKKTMRSAADFVSLGIYTTASDTKCWRADIESTKTWNDVLSRESSFSSKGLNERHQGFTWALSQKWGTIFRISGSSVHLFWPINSTFKKYMHSERSTKWREARTWTRQAIFPGTKR